jgi:wyosine [tRNA(Phe)-imidazoG37] synthetase (radical SAM superfamily)
MLVYGPVPSRRLGRSLGINNIPFKHCTYACVYCQLGYTLDRRTARRAFHAPEEIVEAVAEKIAAAAEIGERIDYLTFVPDGEPTLDINLGQTARMLRRFKIPVAILTNGSLLHRSDVRKDLEAFDWVSLKVDAATEECWRKVDRPSPELDFRDFLRGLSMFGKLFPKKLCTETMLIEGTNDDPAEWEGIGHILEELDPAIAYIAIPTRPPALPGVQGPREEVLAGAYETFSRFCRRVELLTGYEGDALGRTGDPRVDLWSITMVHPVREEAALKFLSVLGRPEETLAEMVEQVKLKRVQWKGTAYYIGKPPGKSNGA